MEPNYVQGLCASIGLLKCSEGENLNQKKKKKIMNHVLYHYFLSLTLMQAFWQCMEKLESYGSGVIWCLLHLQSLTLAQYAECLKHVEIGFKSEFSVRKCNLKILQLMFFFLTHVQFNMLFITGSACKLILSVRQFMQLVKTKRYFNLSLNVKFF